MPPYILQNAVEDLAKKLPAFDFPRSIVRETNERLRVLQTQANVGMLLAKIDRTETRAAVVLEYVCRERLGRKIPMEDLARAVGVKTFKLQELHNIVGNWRKSSDVSGDGARRSTRATSGSTTGAIIPIMGNARRTSHSSTPTVNSTASTRPLPTATKRPTAAPVPAPTFQQTPRESIFSELAIRLSSQVMDPQGCVQSAQRLLKDIHQHIQTSTNAHAAQGHLYDLQRYAAAYEGAAFYHFANEQLQPGEATTVSVNKKKAGRRRDSVSGGGSALDITDLELACSELLRVDLMRTIPVVKEWAKKIAAAKANETNASQGSKKQSSATQGKGPSSKKRQRDPSLDATADSIIDDVDEAADEETTPLESMQEMQRASCTQWRKDLLANAIKQARHALSPDSDDDDEDVAASSLSDEACIEYAANQVFQKYGLLTVE
jgi:hypothetical protein